MSVWLTIPSARPPAQIAPVLAEWRRMGYKIALFLDESPTGPIVQMCDTFAYTLSGDKYCGYAQATNALIGQVMQLNPAAEWFVLGGDDTMPDLNHSAEEIARECFDYFERTAMERYMQGVGRTNISTGYAGTFGVMQPTGDRYAGGCIDRIAGSAWVGRSFAERIYGGKGPLWPEYTHMFSDEELFEVAKKLGVMWQRPDLVHFHKHFMRESDAINSRAVQRTPPPFLREANSPAHWQKYQALFNHRRAAGFPGHEPIGAEAAAWA